MTCVINSLKRRVQFPRHFSARINRSYSYSNDFDQAIDEFDSEYEEISSAHLKLGKAMNCYIIQPYVKWGPQKLQKITPQEQLEEAVSLIKTLPSWTVQDTIVTPLETMDKKTLFKSGTLEKLKQSIRQSGSVSAVFVNISTLKRVQAVHLEKEFGREMFDRYKIVMQILKMHASSKHAKLQVALAELYYLRKTVTAAGAHEANVSKAQSEKYKLLFQNREQKLLSAIKALRAQRTLLRTKREKRDYPVVAVVGYTNAGKTSMIKALTGDDALVPRNQLFATLDVTMHKGLLPSGLEVLYVDTVGFISDIPTNLIECFVATLEDAVFADLVLHVEDISSSCFEFKRNHVNKVLKDLAGQVGSGSSSETILEKTISVGNKCDLVEESRDFGLLKVSSKTDLGIDALRITLERKILDLTDRRVIKIKVPVGGDEIRWLYKNAAVICEKPHENSQFVVANVIITNGKLNQFKHYYTRK